METLLENSEQVDARVAEINKLHRSITSNMRRTVKDAIRIGELLTEIKTSLPYGEWGNWMVQNIEFTDRTARRYMRCYRWKAQLTSDTMSELDLTEAYYRVREKSTEDEEAASITVIEVESEPVPIQGQ